MTKPYILVCNDDGFAAEGIQTLASVAQEFGEVKICAPERNQSAKSHSFSLHKPLRLREVETNVVAIEGTPADCIYAALHVDELLPRKPDLIISGVNHGANLGQDIYYSGTVAAVREGALRGIPGISFSLLQGGTMDVARVAAREILARYFAVPHDGVPFLNVNVPSTKIAGYRATRLGKRLYDDAAELRHDPRGKPYLWIGGNGKVQHAEVAGSDTEAVDAGFVSITPMQLEATAPDQMGLAAYVAGKDAN